MSKPSDAVDGKEAIADPEQLDRSEARERDLIARYQHIRSHMNVTQALERLDQIENAGFQGLLAQLADLGVVIGADAVLPKHLARRHDRFGLTLVLPGHAPLIWLNLIKHDTTTDLVDTVAHEAVHSTVQLFGRLPRTPEHDETIASYGEELVALAGASLILRKIAFPARRQIARNTFALANCKTVLDRLGCSEEFVRHRLAAAEHAAKFFTDFGIDIALPTREEVQSRSGRH